MLYQFSVHGIPVHIVQFLFQFFLAPADRKSPRVNPTRGAPNCAESSLLILSVILRVYSDHDSVGENPIRTRATSPLASTIKRQTSGLPIIDLAGAHVQAGLVHPHLHFI
jgi:hypothetical protein